MSNPKNAKESKEGNKDGLIWLVECDRYVSQIFNNWFQADEIANGWKAEVRVGDVYITRYKPTKDGYDWDGTNVVYYKGKPGK